VRCTACTPCRTRCTAGSSSTPARGAQDPADFVAELSKWLLPPAALADVARGHEDAATADMYARQPLTGLPDVLGTLGTLRKRFHALNYGTDAAKLAERKSGDGGKASNGKR
jgi:hypothetical protein